MTEGHDGARAVNPVRGVHRLAVLTAAATFLLLFVGGLVTSTGSGLAVPDWPLSFGRFFPPMIGGVLFEHGHRMMATPYITLHFAHRIGALFVALADGLRIDLRDHSHRPGDDGGLRLGSRHPTQARRDK